MDIKDWYSNELVALLQAPMWMLSKGADNNV